MTGSGWRGRRIGCQAATLSRHPWLQISHPEAAGRVRAEAPTEAPLKQPPHECGTQKERYGEAALERLGALAEPTQGTPGVVANGRFEQQLRLSLMWVISIGTNEIQRSTIAQRGPTLPR